MNQAILNSALELFQRNGYMKTSVDDIARNAGMTKGGVYYYVDKKEDLLAEIHEQVANALLERLTSALNPEPDPQTKLLKWIEIHAHIMEEYQAHIKIFFTELDNLSEETFRRIVEKRDLIKSMLQGIIAEGIEKKQFRQDIDPNITGLLILGMLNWFYQWYRPSGPATMDEIIENVKAMVFSGVLLSNAREGEQRSGDIT